jgi:hypothetical protein
MEHLVQTAALWSLKTAGAMALPAGFDRATFHRRPEEAGPRRLYAVVEALDGGAAYNARAVDEEGNVYVELDGYRTVSLPA